MNLWFLCFFSTSLQIKAKFSNCQSLLFMSSSFLRAIPPSLKPFRFQKSFAISILSCRFSWRWNNDPGGLLSTLFCFDYKRRKKLKLKSPDQYSSSFASAAVFFRILQSIRTVFLDSILIHRVWMDKQAARGEHNSPRISIFGAALQWCSLSSSLSLPPLSVPSFTFPTFQTRPEERKDESIFTQPTPIFNRYFAGFCRNSKALFHFYEAIRIPRIIITWCDSVF